MGLLSAVLLRSCAVLSVCVVPMSFVDAADGRSVDELLTAIRDKCAEDGGTVPGVGLCELKKEQEYGEQLAKVYAQAIIVAGKDSNLLRESQRNWLKFQKTNCDFYKKRYAFEGEGIARAAAAGCLLRTTLQRLEELRQIVEGT
jgi:uncharacterized protein YecT (DUF1311 family)